ncbi:MAG: MurR/RpiR family transcriptional regulator [Oscillospiraceae bacterium]|nr:MurR/RpiR family transcriptional regulator [Oscillospiraceae bacterium]
MPDAAPNVFDTISQSYYELTAAERKAADYVLKNRDRSQYLSIGELAEESGVAEATVSRFCRRLGYKGYNAFKLAIANAGAPKLNAAAADKPMRDSDDPIELARKLYAVESEAMLQTLSLLRPTELDRAVAILRSARRVLCMGQGGSMILAAEAAHLFSVCDGKYIPVSDSHMQIISAATLTEADAVLFFSYSGATKDMMETLSVVRQQKAKIILITRFPRSPGASLADVVLQCGSNESPLQHGSVPARIAQLFLLDILFTRVTLSEPDGCQESRRRIAAALAEKHL